MRPQNKRSRGRGGGGGMHQGPHQHQGGNRPRGPNRQQTFDSNGPGVKIRGNAYQVFERYMAMAREAQTSGDRISAENLYQHAEHYFRIMTANGEQYPRHQHSMTPSENEQQFQQDGNEGQPQPHSQAQGDGGNEGQAFVERVQPPQQPPSEDEQPPERRD